MPYGAPDTGPELLSLLGEKVDRFELVKRDSPAQAQGALSHLAVFGVEAPASRS